MFSNVPIGMSVFAGNLIAVKTEVELEFIVPFPVDQLTESEFVTPFYTHEFTESDFTAVFNVANLVETEFITPFDSSAPRGFTPTNTFKPGCEDRTFHICQ